MAHTSCDGGEDRDQLASQKHFISNLIMNGNSHEIWMGHVLIDN